MSPSQQKQTGSFYTEGKVAETVVNWAIRNADDKVLEPSFGDGVFIEKALTRFAELGSAMPRITAIEIQPSVAERVRPLFPNKTLHTMTADFLSLPQMGDHDVVIGNPPYVGLKNLPREQVVTARKVIDRYNVHCPNNGSLWFPFVLHAMAMLRDHGRLAFVLPFEITYARYATGLWEILARNFSTLTLCRVHEDFFPNVDVETILLLADGKGGVTSNVNYALFRTVSDLLNDISSQNITIPVETILATEKPFVSHLLSEKQQEMLRGLYDKRIVKPVIESCKFKIGYVSADKAYFHPAKDVVTHYSLSKENLHSCILNAKEINGGTGIGIEVSEGQCASTLFLPKNISEGERLYIQSGEMQGVHRRYKCRQRDPWYVTPHIEIPDVILSVFGENPKLIVNKGKYAVSNSLLCGRLKNENVTPFACRWYNSLTLLSIELNVHSLGGGSFVIIPGEADKLDIAAPLPPDNVSNIYARLDTALKTSGTETAYLLGDKLVLQDIFNLSDKDIRVIRQAIATLRQWRSPTARRTRR